MVDPEVPVNVSLQYRALGGKSYLVPAAPLPEAMELDAQLNRSRFVEVLARIAADMEHDFASGKASLTRLAEQVSRSPSASTERVTALLEDILGQCLEAVEKAEYWQKWGRHYVPGALYGSENHIDHQ